MNFGKLTDLSHVDFKLPADHAQTKSVLVNVRERQPLKVFIGATGWSNPEWNGTWYPKGTRASDYLQHYSRLFGTIEFNTTHYRIPDSALVQRWYHMAAQGFKFCPKVPQQISHYGRLNAPDATALFCESMLGLQELLGPIFIQLPETFGPDKAADVVRFVEKWPVGLPLHWEFRHPDWFNGNRSAEEVFNVLAAHGHGMVITDVAGRRDVLHMRLTNPVVLIRFVGNDLHPSDYFRLEDWVERLKNWQEMGLEACYVFIHQPESMEVPAFSVQWATRILEKLGIETVHPKPLPPAAPQMSLF